MDRAKIVLAENVWKKIEWLTHNYENEIGAFGTGKIKTEDGNKYFYIDELYFPKQKVTSATVTIEKDGWTPIIQELGSLDALKKIIFYWHRHPGGSPHHSGTDEKDTFGTFMSKEANRSHFVFLQTAGLNGETKFEARIELRTPIRAVIEDSAIEIEYESEEDKTIEEYCKNIIKERVSTEIIKTAYTGANNYGKFDRYLGYTNYRSDYSYTSGADLSEFFNNNAVPKKYTLLDFIKLCERDSIEPLSTNDIYDVYVQRDKLMKLEYYGGHISLTVGTSIKDNADKALKENDDLVPLIENFSSKSYDVPNEQTFVIKATKDNFGKLYHNVKMLIGGTLMDMFSEKVESIKKTEKSQNKSIIIDDKETETVLTYLPDFIDCNMVTITDGIKVMDKKGTFLGTIEFSDKDKTIVKGEDLIDEINAVLYAFEGVEKMYEV